MRHQIVLDRVLWEAGIIPVKAIVVLNMKTFNMLVLGVIKAWPIRKWNKNTTGIDITGTLTKLHSTNIINMYAQMSSIY